MEGTLQALIVFVGPLAGIALIIWASAKAKVEQRKSDRQQFAAPSVEAQDMILTELKTLKQQVAEMQNTSHQFDLSFGASLSRLEGRVDHLETRNGPRAVAPNPEATQRIGAR